MKQGIFNHALCLGEFNHKQGNVFLIGYPAGAKKRVKNITEQTNRNNRKAFFVILFCSQ